MLKLFLVVFRRKRKLLHAGTNLRISFFIVRSGVMVDCSYCSFSRTDLIIIKWVRQLLCQFMLSFATLRNLL